MLTGRTAPDRLVPAVLLAAGLAALGGVTLVSPAASRMHAAPVSGLYWLLIALPVAALIWRLLRHQPWVLPGSLWLTGVGILALAILVSAAASPYRAAALQWAALPLAALACFLVLHDRVGRDPVAAARLDDVLAAAAGVVVLAATAWWLRDVGSLLAAGGVARLIDARNPHPLGHSNYTAGVALLALPWLALAARRRAGVPRLLAVGGAVLALTSLFTSGSRGGMLGLGVLLVAAVAIAARGRRRFLLLAGAALLVTAAFALANPRIRALAAAGDAAGPPNASRVQRAAMLTAAWHMGSERPLLGWGLHTTPHVYPRFREQLDGGAENVLQLHSTPAELWAGLGLPGILAAVFLVMAAARDARRAPAASAALAGYGALALTDYQLDVPLFAFGVAAIAARLAASQAPAGPPPARGALAGAVAAAALAVAAGGGPDRAAVMNVEALAAGQDPARREEAAAVLRQSLALNPDQEIAHFNLGWLLLVSDPPVAESHFRAAARLVPDKGGVYFGLGLARLNAGDLAGAARLLALECVNDPRFLASPWWQEPALAALRPAAADAYRRLLERAGQALPPGSWRQRQAELLTTLAPRLGAPGPGSARVYRRERTGYPVLMRNHDLPPPVDLYDVRESAGFEASVPFPLPPKGWLPSPLLRKLLDEPVAALP